MVFLLLLLIFMGTSTVLALLSCPRFCCFVTTVYNFKEKAFLTMYMAFNWHYFNYAVTEHLTFCKIVCVADNSILSKPELLTLS